MKKDHVLYLDYAKGIGILLVIIGHIFTINELYFKNYIYAFHMPLFFIISGILYYLHQDKSYHVKSYIQKSIKTLLIPYWLFALIFCHFSLKNILYILYGSQITLSKAGSLSSLWFIPSFILANLLYILGCHQKSNFQKMLVFLTAIIVSIFLPNIKIGYPFSIDTAINGLTFLIIGFYIAKFMSKFLSSKIFLIIMFLISLFSIVNTNNNYILMATRIFNNPFMYYFFAVAGSLFLLSLAMNLQKYQNNFLKFMGQNSLLILMNHKLVIIVVQSILKKLMLPNEVYLFLVILISIPVVFILTNFLIKVSPVFGGKSSFSNIKKQKIVQKLEKYDKIEL